MLVRKVENKTFKDAVVHVTGNEYSRCKFHSCTFVFHGFPVSMKDNEFHGAHIWRIEYTVHDSDQWDEFVSVLAALITRTLPKLTDEPENK